MQGFGGIGMGKAGCEGYGYELDGESEKVLTDYGKRDNEGVLDGYSREMLDWGKGGIISGLAEGYGGGGMIGEQWGVGLQGVDLLMEEKLEDLNRMCSEM